MNSPEFIVLVALILPQTLPQILGITRARVAVASVFECVIRATKNKETPAFKIVNCIPKKIAPIGQY
jgi:hypothetical protein